MNELTCGGLRLYSLGHMDPLTAFELGRKRMDKRLGKTPLPEVCGMGRRGRRGRQRPRQRKGRAKPGFGMCSARLPCYRHESHGDADLQAPALSAVSKPTTLAASRPGELRYRRCISIDNGFKTPCVCVFLSLSPYPTQLQPKELYMEKEAATWDPRTNDQARMRRKNTAGRKGSVDPHSSQR